MPPFCKHEHLTKEEALTAIIASVAMEEVALASIMKAESEKLRYVIDNTRTEDKALLLAINESVDNVVGNLVDMQAILRSKLRLALKHLPKPHPPCPPPCPPHPPCCCRKCFAYFAANTKYRWTACKTLNLQEDLCRANNNFCCIMAEKKQCGHTIVLPAGKDFRAEIDFDLKDACKQSVIIELKQELGTDVLFSKKYSFHDTKRIQLRDVLDFKSDATRDSRISFKLLSKHNLEIKKAVVKLTAIHEAYTIKEKERDDNWQKT